ncbi:MAG: methyltransferase domain-containing protein [Pyrobaculum sp.]
MTGAMEFEAFDDKTAAFYNFLVSLKVFDWAYAAVAKKLAATTGPGSYVLEIGPGTGPLLKRLESMGYAVVGVDASPPMLKYAQRRVPGASVAGVSFALPTRGGAFDAAVALFTLHHWGLHEPSVAEVWRVLKPRGYFVVAEVDLARMPLVGSHGCTEMCLKEVLSPRFQVQVERKFPLLIAVAKRRD